MSHKRNGMLSNAWEWARHLRPDVRRTFWKSEREAEKAHIRKECRPAPEQMGCHCPSPRPAMCPSWRTDAVVSLARVMNASLDYSVLTILADALAEAGCDSDAILAYCRNPCRHARGCWLAELILHGPSDR